jgi:hypothetical protein
MIEESLDKALVQTASGEDVKGRIAGGLPGAEGGALGY